MSLVRKVGPLKKDKHTLTLGQTAYMVFSLLLFPGLILGLSGDWLWPEAWVFTLWFLALAAFVIAYLLRKDPALLQERLRKPGTGGQESWDKAWLPLMLLLWWAWLILPPLDVKRFHWFAPFPPWVEWLGGLALLPSAYFSCRSYFDNSFVSPLVRIQKERRQKVVTTGVYGWIRHPLYLGAIFMLVGTPLLLNSRAGLVLGAWMSLLVALRILGEEKTLLKGLKGYAAYRKKVKYRLLPGIW